MANVFVCSSFYNFDAVFVNDSQNWDKSLGMRRYEDYSFWSRYLPFVSCMTKTLGRIIEKEISSTVICCRNVQFEIKQLNITHTWCSSVFARSLNKAIRQKPRITQYELRKNVYQVSRFSSQQMPSGFTHI